ncbi:unnamed protein product [Lampetra planeri]
MSGALCSLLLGVCFVGQALARLCLCQCDCEVDEPSPRLFTPGRRPLWQRDRVQIEDVALLAGRLPALGMARALRVCGIGWLERFL